MPLHGIPVKVVDGKQVFDGYSINSVGKCVKELEAWGRGFEIIEESFKNAELEVPQFVEEFSGVTVNIKREVFAAIQHGARIDDRTGKVVKGANDTNDDTKKITDRQQLICNLLAIGDIENDTDNDTKTTSALAIKLGVSKITVKRDLKVLQDLGYIEHCGPTHGGYWKGLTDVLEH